MEWTLIPIRLGMKRKMFSSVWSAGVAGLRSVGCLGRPLLWLIFASAAIVVPGGIRIARVSLVLGRSGAQVLCLSGIAATLCEALVALNSEALVQLVVCVQSLVQVRVPDSGLDSKSKLSLMISRRIWLQESSDRCEFFGTSRVSQEVQTTSSNARKYQP